MISEQQQEIVEAVCSNNDNRIVAVNSLAGCGKSTTAQAVIETFKPKKGFYSAFNKSVIADADKKFGNLIETKTFHSLAYKIIKPRGVEELKPNHIKENFTLDEKYEIINNLEGFYTSKYSDIYEYLEDKEIGYDIKNCVCDYAEKMLNGKINVSFGFLLKYFHLLLENKQVSLDFDLFIIDECQDIVPVMLEIFKLINAERKLLLGDKYQNIYSFMNTVNAFEELDNLNTFKLTRSFRCTENIADIVQMFGKRYFENDFEFKGVTNLKLSNIHTAYITRTNSKVIEKAAILLNNGVKFSLNRSVKELFELPIALLNLSNDKPIYSIRYKFLETEYKKYKEQTEHNTFFKYLLCNTKEPEIMAAIKLLYLLHGKGINIYNLREKLEKMDKDKSVIVTTAHSFKGLEADTVHIIEDLNTYFKNSKYLNKKDRQQEENLYYVALTRAKTTLTGYNF